MIRQPQGRDRVPGRRGRRNRLQPLHDPQSPRHPGATTFFPIRARPAGCATWRSASERSAFYPLEVPQLIEECFDQLLAHGGGDQRPVRAGAFCDGAASVSAAFDDVNKRVSRLAANIPFIKRNLSPLSFIDVPRQTYMEACSGVYELNKIDLLRDVFIWAMSARPPAMPPFGNHWASPTRFRFRHRAALRQVVGEVVRGRMDSKARRCLRRVLGRENIPEADREKFRDMAES